MAKEGKKGVARPIIKLTIQFSDMYAMRLKIYFSNECARLSFSKSILATSDRARLPS